MFLFWILVFFGFLQHWISQEGSLEFWYGGRLYMSKPGTTPFGAPVEKRFMGHSMRRRREYRRFGSPGALELCLQ